MAKPGLELQRLVAAIETATSGDGGVRIESPCRLRDKITGRWREHDVTLHFTHRHRELVVAIECRDRSRKVGVPQLEGFKRKCDDTGVDRGAIVSARGFTQTALTKAKHYNIDCFSLKQALGFDWCLAQGFRVNGRVLLNTSMVAIPTRDPTSGGTVVDDFGRPIEGSRVTSITLDCLRQLPREADTEGASEYVRRFSIESPPLNVADGNGDLIAVTRLNITCRYKVVDELIPHQYCEYTDAISGKTLCSVVSAPIEVGLFKGSMTLTNLGPDGIVVTWSPESSFSGQRNRSV